ncbi:MAG: hypothetical protein HC784_18385 [Hydrococcus sp. CSU_1_8]|nr:hypothetical protein [Hydrococcus sp. CSU_1_8]
MLRRLTMLADYFAILGTFMISKHYQVGIEANKPEKIKKDIAAAYAYFKLADPSQQHSLLSAIVAIFYVGMRTDTIVSRSTSIRRDYEQ